MDSSDQRLAQASPEYEYEADADADADIVGSLLDAVTRRVRGEVQETLRAHGMTPRHGIALGLLRDCGERAQSELPHALGIDPTAVVLLLNELEADGLIERRRSPHDRRRHTVHITDPGRRRLAEMEHLSSPIERRVLGLTDTDFATLHTLLTKAIHSTDERHAQVGASADSRSLP